MAVPHSLYIAVPISLALAACVYVPVTEQTAEAEPACRTFTNKMTVMELREIEARNNGRATTAYDRRGRSWGSGGCGQPEACLAIIAAAGVVAAGTYIVSGSVVVINNTAHWLEYQGTCSDSYLNSSKKGFFDSLGDPAPASASRKGQ
jgi:hypothetical protein